MRQATIADQAALEAFLAANAERAMFPWANLRRFGLNGSADKAMRFWLAEENGRIAGVLGLTNDGSVLPCLCGQDPGPAHQALAGEVVTALIGPRDDVRGLQRALGLARAPRQLDNDEPHFVLDLARMILPAGAGQLLPLTGAGTEGLVRAWMADYESETLLTPKDRLAERVEARWNFCAEADSHRLLVAEGVPLAMTGFNARNPGIVQIGGVYTPPELRGRGHARLALALHLLEAKAQGATRATLFAANDNAARAYVAIGFRRVGDWTLLMLEAPVRIA